MRKTEWTTAEIVEELDIPMSRIKYLITERRVKPLRSGKGRPMLFNYEDYLLIKKYWVKK